MQLIGELLLYLVLTLQTEEYGVGTRDQWQASFVSHVAARRIAGLFLWLFLQLCSFSIAGVSVKRDCTLTCIAWEGAASSQNEFTVTVANVTSATCGPIKPVASKPVLPDECIL